MSIGGAPCVGIVLLLSWALTGCALLSGALEPYRIYRLKLSEGHARAIPLAQRLLATRESRLGPNHLYVGLSVNNLAWLYYETGDYATARSLFERSIAIKEQASAGPFHLVNSLHGLALALGRPETTSAPDGLRAQP
jgi:tetratricopeptide (TPR) repeat protein